MMPPKRGYTTEEIMKYRDSVERKPTLNVQAFADARILAALHNYLAGKGVLGKPTYSTLLTTLLEGFHDMLVGAGKIEPIFSTAVAVETLRRAGYSMAQLEDKRGRRIVKSLIANDLEETLGQEHSAWSQESELDNLSPKEMLQQLEELGISQEMVDAITANANRMSAGHSPVVEIPEYLKEQGSRTESEKAPIFKSKEEAEAYLAKKKSKYQTPSFDDDRRRDD